MKCKLLILDRDGVINKNSSDKDSPFYYILRKEYFQLLPNVKKAFEIIKKMEIPVVLATRQTCISQRLMGYKELAKIHEELEEQVDFKFSDIYVEPKAKLKMEIFKEIIVEFPCIKPSEMVLIDDSIKQCEVARELGIYALCSVHLWDSIKNLKEYIKYETKY